MSYVLTHPTPYMWDHTYSILSGCISPNEPSPDYMRRFDEIICDFMREQGVPGAALCISLHGKHIYRQGYGICRAGQPVSSSSHFRIASISKILTAIGIMRLCEKDIICLDQKVVGRNGILSHIHVSKTRQADIGSITVRHLLEHSGGWDRDTDGDQVFWYQRRPHKNFINVWNSWSLVMHVLSLSLRFEPGTKHAYSNFGYLLLGLVIEKVTKMNYEDYIRDILRDIGIEDISIGRTRQDLVDFREVRYHNNKDPQVERSVFEPGRKVPPQYGSFTMENTGSYGGWVTSAENLVTVLDSLIMMYDLPHLLSTWSVNHMLCRPSYISFEEEAWYGLGLDVEDGGLSFGHTGAMEGTSTTVHHNSNGLTWSLLMNSWAKDMDLDGLVKFALASIPGLPLWQKIIPGIDTTDYFVVSSDSYQCVRILLPHSELASHIKVMKTEGYKISHLSVLTVGHEVFFTLVWQKNAVHIDWGVVIDVDLNEFQQNLAKISRRPIKIVFLEAYRIDRKLLHIYVFEHCDSIDQKIYCIKDMASHVREMEQSHHLGYELRSHSFLYEAKDKVSITAVYDKVKSPLKPLEQEIWTKVPIEEFVEKLADSTSRGLRLEYIKFCSAADMPRITAVLSKCRTFKDRKHSSCRHKSCCRNVFQRHDVSKYGFLFEMRESMKNNRRVLFVSTYEFEGVIYFATIWSAKKIAKEKKKKKTSTNNRTQRKSIENDESRVVIHEEFPQMGPRIVIENVENLGIRSCSDRRDDDMDIADHESLKHTEPLQHDVDLAALNIKIERVEQSDEKESRELDSMKCESDTDTDIEGGDGINSGHQDFDGEAICVKIENVEGDELYGHIFESHTLLS